MLQNYKMYAIILSMNEILKQKFENAIAKEPFLMEEAFSDYLQILQEATLSDAYILSKLGTRLRHLGAAQEFVDKIDTFNYEDVKQKKYVNDSYLYCLYNAKVSAYEYNEETFQEFIEVSEKIVTNCEQKSCEEYNYNPYVLTVHKVIQVLRSRPSTNYFQELKWINKLNPELLPSQPKEIQAGNGKTYELASLKEFYYQVKTRCLEKIENFEECVECCNTALNLFDKLHYRNGLWFAARKLYCECMITGKKEDIENYKEIAERHKFWYMFHKLSNIYLSSGDLENALYYSAKALLSDEFDSEKMINLLYDLGLLFENSNEKFKAKAFYESVLYYRSLAGWHIPEELRFVEKELNLFRDKKPNIEQLRGFALEVIKSKENLIWGKVININKERKFGFIRYDKDKSMYFSLKTIKVPLEIGNKVLFKIETVNEKLCATDIYKIGGNNG